MMAGFKTFVPIRGRRRGITLTANALNLSPEVVALLPEAQSYHLGYDGHRRFVLEPAEGAGGAVKFCRSSKTSASLRCTSKQVVPFLRDKLGAPEKGSVTLSYKLVDGVLMFGILDKEVRA